MTTIFDQRQGQVEPPGRERGPATAVVAVLAVLALVGLAVYVVSRDEPTSVVGSSPGPVATTPTSLAASAPVLVNTGENPDWTALVRSILVYSYWIKVHPDPARQADIYTADYRTTLASGEVITLASATNDIAMLARGDLRYDPAPNEVTASIVTMQQRDATSASVFVRLNPSKGNRTVGRDGTVHQFPDSPGGPVIWRLVLGADGRWRLAGVKPL